ncbi:transcriptional regulator, AlpA family [Shimia sagamensis]|uniref:Transcriptional regulator, AlpA family n=2 Tax=Shimia sagamensis TaxID=1566352 RepID=A0ABY1PKF2_9RHOB|nr:transcriptional regulator, AlpA family [Shimia sagamensis]
MMGRDTSDDNETLDMFERFGVEEPEWLEDAKATKAELLRTAIPVSTEPQDVSRKPELVCSTTMPFPADKQRFLRDQEVADRYGISRQEVWRRKNTNRLPEPIKLSARTTRWPLSELVEFENSLVKENRSGVKPTRGEKGAKKEGKS